MSTTDTGGPAFPRAPFEYIDNGNGLEWAVREQSGMTMLDYVAAKAMQGLMTHANVLELPEEVVADAAYRQAYAMMKEKKARQA